MIARHWEGCGPRADSGAAVAGEVGIPWYVVAVIHNMEAGQNLRTHLHNGDSLTARTVHVPAGRPPGTPRSRGR
jgi:lysozyme family protein